MRKWRAVYIERCTYGSEASIRKRTPARECCAECLAYYLPIDREGAQLLFRVVADSYETRSLILTTNLEFSKWGTVFTDDQMTAAMIDRLAHHGHLLLFEGESYRMQHALMKKR
ncbi:ATP-binding protein [Acidithiobacillus ferrooxidans]|uniref:ATP-binding protein n=1 Tax=Acidithiobacillus ferrooxidans TaxID=920 RepID=UPI0027D34F60|nr:ATP-binding protein [Acidithiobacillus ferrooxidans]